MIVEILYIQKDGARDGELLKLDWKARQNWAGEEAHQYGPAHLWSDPCSPSLAKGVHFQFHSKFK